MVRRARELGYDAIGLTDHNTTGGHVELARECQAQGITPLFGLELDVAHPAGTPRRAGGAQARLTFFAKSPEGYSHLLRLCSLTQPVSLRQLAEFAPHLVMLSGGARGRLYALALEGRWGEAKELAQEYDALFGDHWFVQLEWDTPAQQQAAQGLAALLGEGRCVAGQNACILQQEDRLVLEILSAAQQGVSLHEVSLTARPLLSQKEFVQEFSRFPQALENTRRIQELCSFELPKQGGLPSFPEDVSLEEEVRIGAAERYGSLSPEVEERLSHELEVIQEMGLADYFLIVADIVRFAKQQGIPVGPGRGSAASSVVAYCLGITSVDPMEYGLVFERFLNRARHTLPDIDLDFCYVRRGEVLDYVQRRFGREHVALIGTYGTFGEKTAETMVRDALQVKALGAKEKALVGKIAGLKRHFSTHASGVVISAQPLTCYQAVRADRHMPVTHGDMHALEWQGLLKIDLLGLRTLTFLKHIEEQVKGSQPRFGLESISLDDEKTFALLSRGESVGIFQLESELFQDLLKRMQPRSFAELAALLALGRPGPLSLVPTYLANRAAPEKVHYAHPVLKEILGETYGLAVYQEQVIQLGHRLGGMSRNEADLLRIAISKKDGSLINQLAETFIRGCEENGLSPKDARNLFAAVRRFAGYAFNKSHSVCYALISYRAAYLKAHYPQAFFAALMAGHSGSSLEPYLRECRRLGIPVYLPDVHMSEVSHRPEGEGIRLGLSAIKHVGEAAAQRIVAERSQGAYRSFQDLRQRVDLPKHTLQALVQGGAVDSLGGRQALYGQLGLEPSDGFSRLTAERDLLGAYLSEHPGQPFMAFLRQISGGLAFAAGEISKFRESGGMITGEIDDPSGFVEFTLPRSVKGELPLRERSLAAVFGTMDGTVLRGQRVFPLKPTVILVPKEESLALLQEIIARHQGDVPVVLRLGREILHILPQTYWVKWQPSLEEELQECCRAVQLFEPW